MNRKFGLRRIAGLTVFVVCLAAAFSFAPAAFAVSAAGFTSVDESVDGAGHCQNGNPAVNCNIYDGKQYVWMNGGSVNAALGDGTYFFAVLDPGGQADPNDGSAKNLSSPHDAYTDRQFTVSGGTVSYGGPHDQDGNKIRLMPYDDTSNPGGVYIMAICSLAKGYPVDPSTCKYDAFKVQTEIPIGPASDLTVVKDADGSYDDTFTWGISKDADKTTVNSDGSTGVTFTYTVNVTHDSGTPSKIKVTGTISVFNPNLDSSSNTLAVDIGGVTDKLSDGTVCSVPDGGAQTLTQLTTEFAYSCDLTGGLPQAELDNTAKVTWSDQFLDNGAFLAGGSASFTFKSVPFTATNVDDCVDVTDTVGGALGTVCADESSPKQFTYQNTVPGVSGTCTDYDNTATFTTNTTDTTGSAKKTVTVCVGADLQVGKDAQAAFKRTYKWDLTKSVDKTVINTSGGPATFNYTVKAHHDAGTDSDWVVKGTITVTNPNDWEDITYDLADALSAGSNGSCSIDGGGSSLTVAKSSTKKSTYTCTYSTAPSPASDTNTATATWDKSTYATPHGSASGTAGFNFGAVSPALVDDCVTVSDPNYSGGTPAGTLGGACVGVDPNPATFTYSHTFSGDPAGTCTPHDNTASFTTDDTTTTGNSNKVTVKDCQGADLTVKKDATPGFKRTYKWSISKQADKTTIDPGGTVNYTVTVAQTGVTDGEWVVTGGITVHNPNDWESVTLTGVTDTIDNGGVCTVSGNTTQTIAASSDSTGLTYKCTYASAPSPLKGTNTVKVTWSASAASTPDGSATGQAGADFTGLAPTSTVNKKITVTDTLNGTTTTLGTCTATDPPTAAASCVFKYSRTFSPPSSGCVTLNNTAKIVETGQTAGASVKNCNSGALTMGFWQNKNGQAIITGGASTAGVCNSATWLRNYAPFQDLSATANCTTVANYVFTIIKAANASGSSMNAMLKAQMLATALDVYFSDPALGGNKISAPAPIGGLTIDLTKICKMIDNNSGTGTCSGTTTNASSAFGGATSLTVLQILSYAAGQSNAGGGTWYGNVKATQELAKNTFDSINNQAAVSP